MTEGTAGGIRVRGLTKRFGAVRALEDVSLSAAPGTILGLLGPNGAGKSTLLRILATVVLPDAGTATVAGCDVARQPAAVRRRVGMVLGDERSWYLRISGRRNLEFFAALHGLPRGAASARVDELLHEVGLADAADRRVDGYSSGMRARLALARGLVGRPEALLLDEPTRSVDPVGTAEFRERIAVLARDRGVSVLLATHDLHEAAALADQVVVLAEGRVATTQHGVPDAAALERALLTAVGG